MEFRIFLALSQKTRKNGKKEKGRQSMHHLSLIGGGVSADVDDASDIAGAIANEMRLSR